MQLANDFPQRLLILLPFGLRLRRMSMAWKIDLGQRRAIRDQQ